MFKFNFSKNDDEVEEKESSPPLEQNWLEAEEITPWSHCEINPLDIAQMYVIPENFIINFLKSDYSDGALQTAEKAHSDLITGVYEGGLKIWECTVDLLTYMSEHLGRDFKESHVLDLGCGAGLLGIYALLNKANVDFQDYNVEVLQKATIRNIRLNTDDSKDILEGCKFYSGDWQSFIQLNEKKYDFILTSETIYNPDNYQKLLNVFSEKLKPNGTVYLAAKVLYFGVGGSIREFEAKLNAENSGFKSEVVWKTTDNVHREILKIKKS